VKLVALLAWYDERPDMLRDMVKSLTVLGVDHLVAVDGAYAIFPKAKPSSARSQRNAIMAAASDAGIGCTIHIPTTVWEGNETAKRRFLFQLGETVTTEDDWYFVVDADEVVLRAPEDLKDTLANTPLDVAQAVLLDAPASGDIISGIVGEDDGENMPMILEGRMTNHLPMFFRAIRGLSVAWAHNQYVTPDGRYLWAGTLEVRPEPALRIPQVVVDHRFNRSHERRTAATAYYYARETQGTERQPRPKKPLTWPPNRFTPQLDVSEVTVPSAAQA
jgi:hypothetical protein